MDKDRYQFLPVIASSVFIELLSMRGPKELNPPFVTFQPVYPLSFKHYYQPW